MTYLIFYQTARLLVPLLTLGRVVVDDWDKDFSNTKRGRFGCAVSTNGPVQLEYTWGIVIGMAVWGSVLLASIILNY